jgi:hypothetical protein
MAPSNGFDTVIHIITSGPFWQEYCRRNTLRIPNLISGIHPGNVDFKTAIIYKAFHILENIPTGR